MFITDKPQFRIINNNYNQGNITVWMGDETSPNHPETEKEYKDGKPIRKNVEMVLMVLKVIF